MKKTPYRAMILTSLICTLIMGFLVYYSIGVVDRASYKSEASQRLNDICITLENNSRETSEVMEQVYEDYKSKTRVVAMMLSKTPEIMTDESSLEELRMAVGANIISVSDKSGEIQFSTDLSSDKKSICSEFSEDVGNRVFADILVRTSNGETTIIAGASRLDEDGIIQIEFSPDALDELADYTNITSYITGSPLFVSGCTAIIDKTTYRYVSHTNKLLSGSAVQFPKKKFIGEKGWFKSEYGGSDAMIVYRFSNDDTIVIGIVPYSEIYGRRNSIIKWTLLICVILTITVILSVRQRVLTENQRSGK